MCEFTNDVQIRIKEQTAYKVFSMRFSRGKRLGPLCYPFPQTGFFPVRRGVWLSSRRPGFHVFLTKDGANAYAKHFWDHYPVVVEVRVKGTQFGAGKWEGHHLGQHPGMRVSRLFIPKRLPKS